LRKPLFLKFFKKIGLFITIVALFFSPIFYFNLIIDPYGIFRKDYKSQNVEPNGHFVKMRFLLRNPDRFDSFIFGNSRANNIDIQRLPNGKWYNLYYSLGYPREHLFDIIDLENHSIKIKNILLCLDMSSYMVNYNREHDLLRKSYPNSIFGQIKSYIQYIFEVPSFEYYREVRRTNSSSIYSNFFATGRAVNEDKEKFIVENKSAHASDPKFFSPTNMGYENHKAAALKDIQDIIFFCREHAINIKILINPIHKVSFLATDYQSFFDFLRQLASITNYTDFSGINKITTNNFFYYETSHYRPIVGEAMINYAFYNKRIDSIPEFGAFIKKGNVELHLDSLRKNIAEYK
jgi:hypothetical protein